MPFSLPVRITDNDMVNTHTLKVEPSTTARHSRTAPVKRPDLLPRGGGRLIRADRSRGDRSEFCGHPDADPATCCDPDNHEGDPNCEDLKGLFGNLNGTKRYAYLARSIDEIDNATGLYVPAVMAYPTTSTMWTAAARWTCATCQGRTPTST